MARRQTKTRLEGTASRLMGTVGLICVFGVGGCTTPVTAPATPQASVQPSTAGLSAAAADLVAPWQGPFGGVPDFALLDSTEHLLALPAAVDFAIEEALAELAAITKDPQEANFQNTIAALESSQRTLDRVRVLWSVWLRNRSNQTVRDLQKELAPKLAGFDASVLQNADLFRRVKEVRANADFQRLAADQRRLVEHYFDQFARNGATLSGAKAERYSAIQQELAGLQSRFSDNLLNDEESYVLFFGAQQAAGLPPTVLSAAAQAARDRGRDGDYAVTNTRSSITPILTYADDRAVREQVWRNYYSRGDNRDQYDNNALIAQILQLRHERVGLLGYSTYAAWRLENRMAGTPQAVNHLFDEIWPAALAKVEEEVADMQRLADTSGAGIKIAPWDYRYYGEKVRKAKFALDSSEVAAYLQLERLREAMFYVAGELFGFQFLERPAGATEAGGIPVFHPDVRVWEVQRTQDGAHVGVWYLDPYARQGKRSGAWASGYRQHSTFDGQQTVLVSNNSNFVKPAPGQPLLISWDDARTLFHEFGHALHTLVSNVAYPSLNSGIRDYTEFHSQLLERWLVSEPVIRNYLLHHATGKPIPAELIAKQLRADTFHQGFATTEYLASAIVDMRYHNMDPADLNPIEFERQTLAQLGMPKEIVMRHRSPQFGHAFSSEGYAAGYYGYIWSDVLAADAAQAFSEAPGGLFDASVAASMVEHLFAPRNAVPPMAGYRAFRGREPRVDALLRARGLDGP